jgi:hypothetical protein
MVKVGCTMAAIVAFRTSAAGCWRVSKSDERCAFEARFQVKFSPKGRASERQLSVIVVSTDFRDDPTACRLKGGLFARKLNES